MDEYPKGQLAYYAYMCQYACYSLYIVLLSKERTSSNN
jgi:hypothetical protein